jgi:hypothetical protein
MSLLPVASCLALLAASPALAAAPAPASAPVQAAAADAITDAELAQFSVAMNAVQPIAEALNGAAPNAEQQAQMAAAISGSGLALERFNAISTAVSSDEVVRARLAVAAVPPSPAGSAAAGVTDAELAQFSAAMNAVQPIAETLNGAAPNAEQQAQMAAAISGSGLALERFNAISAAVSQDEHLRARLELADARRAG